MWKNGKNKNKCSPQHKFPLQCSHSLWAKQSTRMEDTYKSTKKPSDSSLLQFPLYYKGHNAIFYGESTILSEVTRCLYPETTLTVILNTTGILNNSVSTNNCSTLDTFIYECLFILRNPTAMKKKNLPISFTPLEIKLVKAPK